MVDASGGGATTGIYGRLSLAKQFLIASLIILLVGLVIIGAWVGQEAQSAVLNRTAAVTGLYVSSVLAPDLQSLVSHSGLTDSEIAALDGRLSQTPLGEQIVAFKVWSPAGEILYSPNHALIGRRFAPDDELVRSLQGEVTADITDLSDPENVYERQHWQRLLQVYLPVQQQGEGRTIAVMEFYQLPNVLEHDVLIAQLRAWAVVSAVMLVMYLALITIVKRGSDTIRRQQQALHEKVAELSSLLEQNDHLHERVLQAAGRTTALNEQALRRIGADLHDGPGQALGLALLRMGAVEENCPANCPASADFGVVQGAMRDALTEIRSISAGLRLPELEPLTVGEVAERAIRDQERRGGAPIHADLQNVSIETALPMKIALFRSIQEALSNALRHGGGVSVSVRVWAEADQVHLMVSDAGPGFVPERVQSDGHLGLAGIRERAELLGGSFTVESSSGFGTRLAVSWPLTAVEKV